MSKWTYVLVFSNEFMTEEEAKHFLNARDDIREWAHIFENVYILVASESASELGDRLIEYVKKNQKVQKPKGRFILCEPTTDRQGWLPQVAWNLLKYQTTEKPEEPVDEEIPF